MTLEENKAVENVQQGSNAGQNAGYTNTMTALKKAETSLPGFSGSYDSEIKSIYDKIVNRQGFKYEHSADPVYGAYRDNYVKQGKRAMMDSTAQAADLTGGYGSSYAQRVGQQQYGAYLERLNEIMPELYNSAYERYKAEGDRLNAQFNAAGGLADREYQRYADEQQRLSEKEKFEYQKQADAFANLYELIFSTGYEPSDAELAASGMSREQAAALSYEFKRVRGLLPTESSSQGSHVNYYNLSPTSVHDIGYREGMFGEREQQKQYKV